MARFPMSVFEPSKIVSRFDNMDLDLPEVITLGQVGRVLGLLALLGLALLCYNAA